MKTATRERPILFSAPMVLAMLAGRKTQTRRVVGVGNSTIDGWSPTREWWRALDFSKAEPRDKATIMEAIVGREAAPIDIHLRTPRPDEESWHRVRCNFDAGDRLWVKESYRYAGWSEEGEPTIEYRADGATLWPSIPDEWSDRVADIWAELSEPSNFNIDNRAADRRWRPSIHMPRWASRITLEVVSVRVERVQAISEEDAIAEGFTETFDSAGACHERTTARENFLHLFYDINKRASRGSNPWVWVIEFKRLEES